MRKWVIALVVLLLVVAIALAFALAGLNRWLQQNRDWVAAQASKALGREVRFEEIGVSLRGGVAGRLGNLSVADDPSYAREPFLRARNVQVALRILPALFGRYEVRYVAIEEPELTVIRDPRGMNVSTLGGAKPGAEKAPAEKQPAAAALLVSSIRIEDGRLRFIDRTATPPAEYLVQKLDVRASDVSPTTSISLDVSAAVLGAEKQNIRIEGKVGPVASTPMPVDVTVRLDEVSPAALDGTIAVKADVATRAGGPPAANGTATLRGVSAGVGTGRITDLDSTIELKGDSAVVPPTRFKVGGQPMEAEATVERFQPVRARFAVKAPVLDLAALGYGSKGDTLRDLETRGTAEGSSVKASVRSPRGTVSAVEYQNLEADVTYASPVATLDRLRVAALQGTYEGSGRFDMRAAERPRFDSRSTVRGMALRELLARGFPAAAGHMEGKLDANLALAGAGRDGNAIRPTLEGQGRADVRDGVLKDVNVAESVLGGVTGIAGLSALVPPDVRTRYPDVFGTGDTRFQQLGGNVRIGDQRIATDDLVMAARDYAVNGRGHVGFDGRVDFTATLVASERLTADILKGTKEARYLTNPEGRLAIPFRFVGKMPGVKPVPDAEWLARTLARGAVGRGIEKLLPKKKGGKERPGEERLRKGLEGLFGR